MPEIYNTRLQNIEYDAEEKALTITFTTGYRTRYFGVSKSVYKALSSATSKDAYFKDNIENHGYAYQNC
jgi:hypothetical protein